jgi:hypothetical protein
MKLRPINSTQDLLRLVPGLFIAQHQGGGKAEQIFIRGFDCDHGTDINVSVDNMPVNMVSHAHGQGFADAHFIIPESIHQLTYGKGPYDADKGNFYTAGYVAFKTKNTLQNNFVTVEGGKYDYFRTAAGINLLSSTGKGVGHSTAYVIGEYAYNRSYFDASQDFNRISIVGKYTNYISPNKTLLLTLSGFHSFWNASGQIPERAVAEGIIDRFGSLDNEGGVTSRYNANVEYLQQISDRSYFRTNLYLTRYDFSLYSDFTYFAVHPDNGDQILQAENRVLCGYNAEYTNTTSWHDLRLTTKAGIGIRYDQVMNDELAHVINKSIVLSQITYGDVHEMNLSEYTSERIQLGNFALSMGLRYDHFIQRYLSKLPADKNNSAAETSRISPKAGLVYNINEDTRLYYYYGTGFHTNDTRTMALGQQLGNSVIVTNAVPRAFAHDLGIEHTFDNRLAIGAAIWLLDLQQEFGYSGDEAVVDTSGKTRRYGFDITARYQPFKSVTLFADVNFAHGRFVDQPEGNNYIPLAPTLTSTGGVKYNITSHLAAGLQYRYMSNRPGNNDNSLVAQGYTLLDGGVSYSWSRFEYNLQAQNILNIHWREAQFATETRLRQEVAMGLPAVTDICFTPGTPFCLKASVTCKF